MEKEDNGSDIQAQELALESSSDSKNEHEANEVNLAPTENPDTESMGNEKEKDEECEILEVGDSPNNSLPSPEGGDAHADEMNDQDPQDVTENRNDGNAEEKEGPTSISLSTLISTIIKGTVASMDDVGIGKQGSKGPPLPLSPGEIVSSSQLQDGALNSASDNQTDVTNGQENTDEVLENSLPPAYDSVVDVKRRGPDRRPRMQHRFSLSRMGTYEEPLEVPKTETIDTDGGKIYQCLSCKVSFNYEQDMQMHLQTHLRPRYFCPVCSKRFLNQSTLERHMVTHEQTKPFVCSICSQGFRIKSNLNRHYQRIHNNSKVDLGEPRRGRPMSSVPRSSMPHPVDTLPKAKFAMQGLGMVPRSIPQPYPLPASYTDSQIPLTNFAAPQIDFHPSLRYEQVSNHPEPENNTVTSAERIADFPQSPRKFDFDQSPYVNPVALEKPDLQENHPNTSLAQNQVPSMNLGDEEDSHAHHFLSRYPDVESAVDAIRRIETERLFHQELLLEELKLRRKYGLPSSNVLEDLKKEIALKEKIGDMDSLIAQGGNDLGRAEALKSVNPLIDPISMTGTTSLRTSPNYDDSFQTDLSRGAYLLGGQAGRQEGDETTSRGIPSDLIQQSLLSESQASAQLRRLSAFSTAIHSPYPQGNEKGNPGNMPTTSDVQLSSPHVSDESSNDWSASQHLKSFTPRFGRPRRGRRRLASMPPSLPSHYADESEIQQQDVSFEPRKQGSPAPFSQVLVHHRPSLPQNSSRAMKPPPTTLRSPALHFRSPQNLSHRFPSVATLPPPPEYILPSSPHRPMPKRFRPTLAKTIRSELQRLEDFTNQREMEPVDAMRTGFDNQPTKPIQVSPVSSEYVPAHVDTVSNPFTMSGPPNRSVKPSQTQSSLQNPNPQPAFTFGTQDAPSWSSSNQVSDEADTSPLDLSRRI